MGVEQHQAVHAVDLGGSGRVGCHEAFREFIRLELYPIGDDGAVIGALIVAGLDRLDGFLHVFAQSGAGNLGVDDDFEGADAVHVVGEAEFFHIDFAADDVGKGGQLLGVGHGDGEFGQRKPVAQLVGFPDRIGGRAHAPHGVHGGHQVVVGREVVGHREVCQVHGAFAGEAPPDDFGQHGQQGCGHPGEGL